VPPAGFVAGAVTPWLGDPPTGSAEAAAARIAALVAEIGLGAPTAWGKGTAEAVADDVAPTTVDVAGPDAPGLSWAVVPVVDCGIGAPEDGGGEGLDEFVPGIVVPPVAGIVGLGLADAAPVVPGIVAPPVAEIVGLGPDGAELVVPGIVVPPVASVVGLGLGGAEPVVPGIVVLPVAGIVGPGLGCAEPVVLGIVVPLVVGVAGLETADAEPSVPPVVTAARGSARLAGEAW
jgi:hypothetical protein